MRTLHLFAGAGGGLLADLILGHRPVCAVEWDAHCCAVLRERAADGWFPGLHVHEGDIRMFDPSEWAGRVDCIAAGFPCQDISAAGPGGGIKGARSGLVREVFRAIDAIRPQFVFLENSPLIRTRGRPAVIGDLVARGYSWRDGTLAASDVGAPHRRARWFCLAKRRANFRDPHGSRLAQRQGEPSDHGAQCPAIVGADWWATEPALGRVAHGMASRVDRMRALGNGQVPLQAAAAWLLLCGRQ